MASRITRQYTNKAAQMGPATKNPVVTKNNVTQKRLARKRTPKPTTTPQDERSNLLEHIETPESLDEGFPHSAFERTKIMEQETPLNQSDDINIVYEAKKTKKHGSFKIFIPEFTGNNMSIQEFIDDCRSLYDLIDPDERLLFIQAMKKNIKGEAKTHLALSLGAALTFEKIQECLERAYKIRKSVETLQSEMGQMGQNDKQEGVLQFYNRITGKLRDIFSAIKREEDTDPLMERRAQKFALKCFVTGLYPKLGELVRIREPRKLEEAIELAIKEEDYLQERALLYPGLGNVNQRFQNNETSEPATPTVSVNTIMAKPDNKTCYRCDQVGHIAKFCKTEIKCDHCNKKGHIKKYCYSLHGKEKVLAWIQQKREERATKENLNIKSVPRNDAARGTIEVTEPN